MPKLRLPEARSVRFDLDEKAARVIMRLPEPLLDAVKARARARGARALG